MADEKVYLADKTTLDMIKNLTEKLDQVTEDMKSVVDINKTNILTVDGVVDTILERIGAANTTGGTATAGTLMSKLNAIYNFVDTLETNLGTSAGATGGSASSGSALAKLNAIINYVDTVESSLTTINNTVDTVKSNLSTVSSNVSSIKNNGTAVVRHIQRGTFKGTSGQSEANIALSGFVNIDKMVVILNNRGNSNPNNYDACLSDLASTNLKVNCGHECVYSYQVIEFY